MSRPELERCRPWIEAALVYSGGTHTFDDVADMIKTGRLQLWPAPKGCLVTEILVYPRKTVLNVFLGGGDLDQLADMHGDMYLWAKAQGCTAAMIQGRKGWERVLRSYGWKARHILLTKEFKQ
jgi:hypothetical protein